MENVGPGDNHGCPYRHHDPDILKASLIKSGIASGSDDLNQIMQFSKEGHYQKACSLQFRASHKGAELSTGITQHPNQFYQGNSIESSLVIKMRFDLTQMKFALDNDMANSFYVSLNEVWSFAETPDNKLLLALSYGECILVLEKWKMVMEVK